MHPELFTEEIPTGPALSPSEPDWDSYIQECRTRWDGHCLHDAARNWHLFRRNIETLRHIIRPYLANNWCETIGGEKCLNPEGTLTAWLWLCSQSEGNGWLVDFCEHYQRCHLRRGLIAYCKQLINGPPPPDTMKVTIQTRNTRTGEVTEQTYDFREPKPSGEPHFSTRKEAITWAKELTAAEPDKELISVLVESDGGEEFTAEERAILDREREKFMARVDAEIRGITRKAGDQLVLLNDQHEWHGREVTVLKVIAPGEYLIGLLDEVCAGLASPPGSPQRKITQPIKISGADLW